MIVKSSMCDDHVAKVLFHPFFAVNYVSYYYKAMKHVIAY